MLQSGNDPTVPGPSAADSAIAQTGLVPVGSQSIRFIGSRPSNGFTLSLGGAVIPMAAIGTQGIYTIYGGDISEFAGLTEELRISVPAVPFGPANLYLDGISFSPEAIPEPSAAALLLCGAAVFWTRLRRNIQGRGRA